MIFDFRSVFMKFKALFVIFNIVLLFSFLTIFLLPFFILDPGFMAGFWAKNWYFGALFVAVMGVVNVAFALNWKTLSYLEREDWPGLAAYLERDAFDRNRLSARKARLLCDSLLLLGDFDTLRRLEDELRPRKPRLLASLSVRFAAAYLLSSDYARVEAVTAPGSSGADRDWLCFYAAFSRNMQSRFGEASRAMIDLVAQAREPIVQALAGFLCAGTLARNAADLAEELDRSAESAKSLVLASFTKKKWLEHVEDRKSETYVVILSKLIDESTAWLFPDARGK
jgi:hypothetical protein